jgi:hypothetical protein
MQQGSSASCCNNLMMLWVDGGAQRQEEWLSERADKDLSRSFSVVSGAKALEKAGKIDEFFLWRWE